MVPLSTGAVAAEQTNASLITLPDEIQHIIYKYVYPTTDIVLRPDSDPGFVPRSLTQSFNILGSHSVSLLLTNSKICAIAKPVRDSSFTGRVNASRVRDLASCGHWIHNNLTTVRILVRGSPPTWGLHLSLFPNLRDVELIRDEMSLIGSEDFRQMPVHAYLRNEQKDQYWRFFQHAKDLKCLCFSPVVTRNHPTPPPAPWMASSSLQAQLRQLHTILQPSNPTETIVLDSKQLIAIIRFNVRLRYMVKHWPFNGKISILGITVVMHNGNSYVTSKGLLTEHSFTYIELDPFTMSTMKSTEDVHTEGGGAHSNNQTSAFLVSAMNSSTASAISNATTTVNGVNALNGNGAPNNTPRGDVPTKNTARVVHAVAHNAIPRRYAWIKDFNHDITWDDLD